MIRTLSLAAILFSLFVRPNANAAEVVVPSSEALDNIVESVEFHEAPITDILRLLARQNDLNLIIGPDSMGFISLRFSGVTLRAALDAILRSKGFQYQIFDNIMLVTKPDSLEKIRGLGLESRLFKLKYTDARDMKMAIDSARVLSPWGFTSVFSRSLGAGTTTGRSTGSDAAAGSGARSDVLLVTDKRNNLESVAALIEDLDRQVKQVTIDVKFVETILTDNEQIGIDWQQILSVQGAYKGKTSWKLGGENPLGGGGTIEFGALNQTRFDAILDVLLRNQRSKLLSQPRIATMDNQPASISIGTIVWVETRSSDVTGNISSTFEKVDIPIELRVTPHILEGDRVLLELRPIVEELTGWQEGSQGQQLPLISSRTANTRIEVKSGETAVIGGLIKDKKIYTTKKVWLLGSIPLLGHLFRHRVESVERSDLSIFITPKIVRDDQVSPFESPPDLFSEPVDTSKKEKVDTLVTKPKEPAITMPEVVDLRPYFPIPFGARWSYDWKETGGEKWRSDMIVEERDGELAFALESIPSGKYQSSARSCYKWDGAGLVNLYRMTPGKDSVFYSPVRYILPAQMEVGREYENSYAWTTYGVGGQKTAKGQVRQRQKLLRGEAVTLSKVRYKDCILVETIWWDSTERATGVKRRKLVWYARDVGPVKVEHDIALDESATTGKMSAVLAKR